MQKKRDRVKNRKSGGSFFAMPHAILNSREWAELSSAQTKLLMDLAAQFNGKNNGDLTTAYTVMQKRGWHSKTALFRAMHGLENTGWIIRTRRGGLHVANLFALSWLCIDECDQKLDIASTKTAPNTWKKLDRPVSKEDLNIILSPETGLKGVA